MLFLAKSVLLDSESELEIFSGAAKNEPFQNLRGHWKKADEAQSRYVSWLRLGDGDNDSLFPS